MDNKERKYHPYGEYKIPLRSLTSTSGRRMAGARALWRANGMKPEHMGKPIIAIVNSFTQFVPGHVHLHEIGQLVKQEIEKLGCFAAESIPSPLTMALQWGTTECFTRCLRAISLPIRWNTWSMPTKPMR